MIEGKLLLSSAYFPPVNYISLISAVDSVLIEREETYLKQTYRNRCRICSANGPLTLSVPVLFGTFHKSSLKSIRIDYTKRWQQVHLGAIESSYRSSPYFEYYFDHIRDVINIGHEFLTDLNMHSLNTALALAGITTVVCYTNKFTKPCDAPGDFRYLLSPKKRESQLQFSLPEYPQVFSERYGFVPELSIIDLLFNTGPDSLDYLRKIRFSNKKSPGQLTRAKD